MSKSAGPAPAAATGSLISRSSTIAQVVALQAWALILMRPSAAPVFFTFAANNETPSKPQVNQLMSGCDISFGGDCRHLPTISRSEEHTSELQSLAYLVCRLLLEKKKKKNDDNRHMLK